MKPVLDHMTLLAFTRGPEFGEASPWGLVITLLLLAGTILLIKSMNGHIRRLPESFDDPSPERSNPDGDR